MSLSRLESSVLLPVPRAPKRKKLRCNDMLAILFSILGKCTPFIKRMQRGNYQRANDKSQLTSLLI